MSDKCIVFGCSNHKHQGRFVGDICAPCYEHITTRNIGPTTSFLGKMQKDLAFLYRIYQHITKDFNGAKLTLKKMDVCYKEIHDTFYQSTSSEEYKDIKCQKL